MVEWGKVIFQVSIAVFRVLSKNFLGKDQYQWHGLSYKQMLTAVQHGSDGEIYFTVTDMLSIVVPGKH